MQFLRFKILFNKILAPLIIVVQYTLLYCLYRNIMLDAKQPCKINYFRIAG